MTLKASESSPKSKQFDSARETMIKHLAAIDDKDLEALANTLSPDGKMLFILPASEIQYTTEAFLDYHRNWFKQVGWTAQNTIVDVAADKNIADIVVELMYREADRNGKPYFNKLMVSYRLKKIDGTWYVTKDHATSIDKTPS